MDTILRIFGLLKRKPVLALAFLILALSLGASWLVYKEVRASNTDLVLLRKDYDRLATDYGVIREFVLATFKRPGAVVAEATPPPTPTVRVPTIPTTFAMPPMNARARDASERLKEIPDRADFRQEGLRKGD